MTSALLTTKLFIPRNRRAFLRRPRLIERLEEGRRCRLTLVAAPAGYGKTALVADWMRGLDSDTNAVWLSLDAGDSEPVQLMAYMAEALQRVDDALHDAVVQLLGEGELSADAFVTLLLDHASDWPGQTVLVLDDYHAINSLAVHELLRRLVRLSPSSLHLVVVSRSDPPLPLSRLRLRGELMELRASDLRLTIEEASAFLHDVMGLDLDEEGVAGLEARTEGWIAGLQLAGLSLRGEEDPGGRVRRFTGEHRQVVDYLTEDVMARQAEAVQDFLCRTSVLDRLCAALCDAVTGRDDGQAMLEQLERDNLFLVPLDDERVWYRYHHLFSDALGLRLRTESPELVASLHERAARWYRDEGMPEPAVEHALNAEAYSIAEPLIEQQAETVLFAQTRWATLLRWTERLPPERIADRPGLGLARAWGLFTTGRWQSATIVLDQVERALTAQEATSAVSAFRAEVTTIRACIDYELGDMEASLSGSRTALRQLPPTQGFVRSVAELNAGLTLHLLGDPARADKAFDRALGLALPAGNKTIELFAIGGHMQVAMSRGELRDVAALYARARELGLGPGGITYDPAGMACVLMGDVLREWNHLLEAERVLGEGVELCAGQRGMPEYRLQGQIALARVLLALGDVDAARAAAIRFEEQLAIQRERPGDVDVILARALRDRLRYRLALGGVAAASEALRELQGSVPPSGTVHRVEDALLDARLQLLQAAPDAALERLAVAGEDGEGPNPAPRVAEAAMLEALAHAQLGRSSPAASALRHALVAAGPGGYVRLFLDEGAAMADLLRTLPSDGALGKAAPELLALLDRELGSRTGHAPAADRLVEPLSEREAEILALIAAGRSNPGIASELHYSPNTIKVYVSQIYDKLGVRGRAQAVSRAYDLGLLRDRA